MTEENQPFLSAENRPKPASEEGEYQAIMAGAKSAAFTSGRSSHSKSREQIAIHVSSKGKNKDISFTGKETRRIVDGTIEHDGTVFNSGDITDSGRRKRAEFDFPIQF